MINRINDVIDYKFEAKHPFDVFSDMFKRMAKSYHIGDPSILFWLMSESLANNYDDIISSDIESKYAPFGIAIQTSLIVDIASIELRGCANSYVSVVATNVKFKSEHG